MATQSEVTKDVLAENNIKKTEEQKLERLPPFSSRVVNAGFITGLALAALCLILSGGYLIYFHQSANGAVKTIIDRTQTAAKSENRDRPDNVNSTTAQPSAQRSEMGKQEYEVTRLALSVHMYIARISLLSTGVFVGLAFGFLGFSLFLIGINGSMDASLETAGNIRLQAARIAPGVFVLLAATILIGVCVTRSLPVSVNDGHPVNAVESDFPINPPRTSSGTDPLSGVDPRMPSSDLSPSQSPAPTASPSVNQNPNDRSLKR